MLPVCSNLQCAHTHMNKSMRTNLVYTLWDRLILIMNECNVFIHYIHELVAP